MPDPPRLLEDATAAFIDRTPIAWSALLSRVRMSPDRAIFENLHALATVRGKTRAAASGSIAWSRVSAAAWIVVALGAVETLLLLVPIAWALLMGARIGDRAPQLILALAFAASSVPLGAASVREPRSLFLLATFTTTAGLFAQSAVRGLAAPWSVPFDPLRHGVWIDAFLPACLWQFALGFPQVLRFTRFDRFARQAVAALWLLGACLFAFNIVVTSFALDAGLLGYLSPDDSSYLSWRLISLALAGALLAILVRSRRAPLRERRRVARLAQAIAIGLGPFLLFAIIRTFVPGVEQWFRSPGSLGAAALYGLIIAALAATPVLSTAAVLVDRPFELEAAGQRRRGWRGVLASRSSRSAHHDDGRVAQAMARLSRARGTREAIACLSREIGDLVGAESVGIFLLEQDGNFVQSSNASATWSSDGALAALIREVEEPLDLSPAGTLFPLLRREDRDWIAANGIHLIAPLTRRDGEMAAVVTIGRKTAGAPYHRRDRWLTVALIAATVAAFDDDRRSRGSSTDAEPRGGHNEAAFECPQCGVVAESDPLPCDCGRGATLAALPAVVAEKFLVTRRVGAGGMGVVYLARDAVLDRDVALKTLPSLRPRAVEQLREEARAMAALNHESLATLYGLEIWRGTPVLVVEYFPEGTLAARLSRGPLAPADAVAIGIRLARALVYMHTRAVLHRDLKPSNIAFAASGAAKLLDFGLATLSSPGRDDETSNHRGTGGQAFIGTRGYSSPETLRGEPSSAAGDRWALAVVVLEAVSGVNPFANAGPHPVRRPSSAVPATGLHSARLRTGPVLGAFLERALAPSPEDRFHTSDDFLAALKRVADALTPCPPPTVASPLKRTSAEDDADT